jgi:hypothetical protein
VEEVRGDWRQLFEEEICGLSSSKNIIQVIKKRRTQWGLQVAHMGKSQISTEFWWGSLTEVGHLVHVGVGGGYY